MWGDISTARTGLRNIDAVYRDFRLGCGKPQGLVTYLARQFRSGIRPEGVQGADIFAEMTEDLALTDEQMALYTAHKDAARS